MSEVSCVLLHIIDILQPHLHVCKVYIILISILFTELSLRIALLLLKSEPQQMDKNYALQRLLILNHELSEVWCTTVYREIFVSLSFREIKIRENIFANDPLVQYKRCGMAIISRNLISRLSKNS